MPLDEATAKRAQSRLPDWAASRAATALPHYEKLGMPSEKEEVWRYVDLGFDIGDYHTPDQPGDAVGADDVLGHAIRRSLGAVHVVDGAVVAVEAGDGALVADDAPEATFGSLRELDGETAASWATRYGSGIPVDLDKFAAAHHAFGHDGVVLTVPAGRSGPGVYYVDVQASRDGAVSFPHLAIEVEEGAEAGVVVNLRSPDAIDALVVPQIEAWVGANGSLALSVVQNLGRGTRSIAHGRVVLGRDARLRLAEAGLGGVLSRLWLTVDLEGRGSSADIVGAYFGDRTQTLDYRYFMHHAGTNTNSNMFLKGAVEDEALSVFTGMIRIDEGAQRTDAFQTNRNLILSDGAAAQSVPNLEILANDVRCGHGSTVGPLDEEQRYYLMSRGLDRPRADRLQVRGFFEEAIRRFPHEGIAEPLRRWMNGKFIAAQEEGRV